MWDLRLKWNLYDILCPILYANICDSTWNLLRFDPLNIKSIWKFKSNNLFVLKDLILKLQRASISFKSWFGLWMMLEVTDLGLASWSSLRECQWSLIYPSLEVWFSTLILKVWRTSISFKSWFGALENTGSSWLGFGI